MIDSGLVVVQRHARCSSTSVEHVVVHTRHFSNHTHDRERFGQRELEVEAIIRRSRSKTRRKGRGGAVRCMEEPSAKVIHDNSEEGG